MRRFLGSAAALLIGLTAAWSMLGGIPEGGDTLLHLYRAVQLDALFQEGILYSRWAPDLAYGYGYPLFNYYAPLAYYLVELIHLLGLSLTSAFLVSFIAAFMGASLFTYAWVRSIFGQAAGLAAAALYAFSPYLMVDGFQRGALAELLALALLPLILWAVRLLILSRRWTYGLVATLAYAALILTHNISALVFTPVLIAYAWMIGYSQAPAGPRRWLAGLHSALPALGLMVLSLGLSAFYWLPALAEQNLVRISQAYGPAHFDYSTNFLGLGDLLALPFVVDPNLVQQDVPIAISLIAALLAVAGLASLGRYRADPGHVGHILFAALVVVVGLFMALPVSAAIWDRLPLLPFVQFPWRFLGLVSLFLAMLAGVGLDSLLALGQGDRRLRLALPALVVGLAALYMLPWRYTDTVDPPPPTTIAGAADFARQSGALGTTSAGEYLPVAVSEVPVVVRPGFPEDETRLDPESLPGGASLLAADYEPLAYEVTLDSPVPFTAIFRTFFFEGWRGTMDGQPVELRATGPMGLIGLEVPAGEHQVAIRFESTTIRDLATAISWFSLLLLAPALFLIDRRGGEPAVEMSPAGPAAMVLAVILVLLAMLLLGFVYFDRPESLLRQTRLVDGQVIGADLALNADFERQLILLAADVPEKIAADEELILLLYWRTPQPVDQEYSTSVVVVDGQGLVVGQSDRQHPGVLPTTRWEVDEYARDQHTLNLLPGTPPGDYQVQVRVYQYGRPDDRLSVLDENGAPVGQSLTIAPLVVERPETAADLEELAASQRVDWPAGDGLVLAAYTIAEGSARAGEPLFLELYWQATAEIANDEEMAIELVDGRGESVQVYVAPLVEGLPTSSWQPGDLWRATHTPRLPAAMPGGDYEVVLRLDRDRQLPLGSITVSAPEHSLTPPVVTFPAEVEFGDARLGDVARLVGYNVSQVVAPGETLPVTLVWLALGETPVSYKVFVQLLDGQGRLVTGSDTIPASWERPTTGWIAGEYITDRHELHLPADLQPGVYQLLIGLYDEATGVRVATAEGQDAYQPPLSIDIPDK